MGKNKDKKKKEIDEEAKMSNEAEESADNKVDETKKAETKNKESKESEAKKPETKEPTLEEKYEDLNNRLLRNLAEFDNFRKRSEKEKAARFEIGQRSVVEKILPIVDNFERGLVTIEGDKDAFAEGMEKTYKQLTDLLGSLNVKPIEAVGKEFDPNFHNAVMHVEDDGVGENMVVEELQKGYEMNGTVIRYSMVKVAN